MSAEASDRRAVFDAAWFDRVIAESRSWSLSREFSLRANFELRNTGTRFRFGIDVREGIVDLNRKEWLSEPDISVVGDQDVLERWVRGTLSTEDAFVLGNVEVQGPLDAVLRLYTLLAVAQSATAGRAK